MLQNMDGPQGLILLNLSIPYFKEDSSALLVNSLVSNHQAKSDTLSLSSEIQKDSTLRHLSSPGVCAIFIFFAGGMDKMQSPSLSSSLKSSSSEILGFLDSLLILTGKGRNISSTSTLLRSSLAVGGWPFIQLGPEG